MNWTPDAEENLKQVPFLVRPVVRRKIESLAKEAGLDEVDAAFFDAARAKFSRN